MPSHRITMTQGTETFYTLEDILPPEGEIIRYLFIGKSPINNSVDVGHYYQGDQGRWLFDKLQKLGILNRNLGILDDEGEDDYLLKNGHGIIDISRKPMPFGDHPLLTDIKRGIPRVMPIIYSYKPEMIIFVFKKALDYVLKYAAHRPVVSRYGFNDQYTDLFGKSRVFVFPNKAIGPCNKQVIRDTINELREYLGLPLEQ